MTKALVLGGRAIGSYELVQELKKKGVYTIVTDYLSVEGSPAKRIADEYWDISTAEVDILCELCKKNNITAVLTAVHEFNIVKKIEICDKLGLPQYCNMEQWDVLFNKRTFKDLCRKFDIPIATTYKVEEKDSIPYPVIVKPEDSSSSRGFSICRNADELLKGIDFAKKYSDKYLIEEFVDCEAGIVHYTAINGELYFSGMSDKHSQLLPNGSSVMAFQAFPSIYTNKFLEDLNDKVVKMFKSIGIKDGPIWIEVFNDIKNNRFVFNEMGYRFGGSMTNYPVEYFYNIDQMDLMIDNALGIQKEVKGISLNTNAKNYCILPIHISAGVITKIEGLEEVQNTIEGLKKVVTVHYAGDKIENWGTAQNVYCYLHILYDDKKEIYYTVKELLENLQVLNEDGKQMLYLLYDINSLLA